MLTKSKYTLLQNPDGTKLSNFYKQTCLLDEIEKYLISCFGKNKIEIALDSNTPCKSRALFSWTNTRLEKEIKSINIVLNKIKNLKETIQQEKCREIIDTITQCLILKKNKNSVSFSQLLDNINHTLVLYFNEQENSQAILASLYLEKEEMIRNQEIASRTNIEIDFLHQLICSLNTKLKLFLDDKEDVDDLSLFIDEQKKSFQEKLVNKRGQSSQNIQSGVDTKVSEIINDTQLFFQKIKSNIKSLVDSLEEGSMVDFSIPRFSKQKHFQKLLDSGIKKSEKINLLKEKNQLRINSSEMMWPTALELVSNNRCHTLVNI